MAYVIYHFTTTTATAAAIVLFFHLSQQLLLVHLYHVGKHGHRLTLTLDRSNRQCHQMGPPAVSVLWQRALNEANHLLRFSRTNYLLMTMMVLATILSFQPLIRWLITERGLLTLAACMVLLRARQPYLPANMTHRTARDDHLPILPRSRGHLIQNLKKRATSRLKTRTLTTQLWFCQGRGEWLPRRTRRGLWPFIDNCQSTNHSSPSLLASPPPPNILYMCSKIMCNIFFWNCSHPFPILPTVHRCCTLHFFIFFCILESISICCSLDHIHTHSHFQCQPPARSFILFHNLNLKMKV